MKLNRKGFTLIELLAVIIILAIVVGITIPAIMSTVSNAKQSAYNTAAQSCADWIERQYQIYMVDSSDKSLNASLKTKFASAGTTAQALDATLVEACGLKSGNVDAANTKFKVNNGRVCLQLKASSTGDYKDFVSTPVTGGACTGVTF